MPDGALPMPTAGRPVLDVRGLKTVFGTRAGEVHAVNEVSFVLRAGHSWACCPARLPISAPEP
jgi:ABC-type glutathione transport system ATPase component